MDFSQFQQFLSLISQTERDLVKWNEAKYHLQLSTELTFELKKFCKTIFLLHRSTSSREKIRELLIKKMEEINLFQKLSVAERERTLNDLSRYQIRFDPYQSELRSRRNVNIDYSFQSIQINKINEDLLNIVVIVSDELGNVDSFLKFKISKEVFHRMRYHMAKSLYLMRNLKQQLSSHFVEMN